MKVFEKIIPFTIILTVSILLSACQHDSKPDNKTPAVISDNWQLIPKKSTLSFITTKNKVISEEHTLKLSQGQIHNLKFEATIDLNTIDTQIEIRDQRMRDILFQTESFPQANISSQLPDNLSLNQTVTLPFILNLHGHQKTYNSQVLIQMVEDQLVVTNYDPVTVNAKDFDLDGAVNQLTKIAGLQGINYDVLVDFKLTFEKLMN